MGDCMISFKKRNKDANKKISKNNKYKRTNFREFYFSTVEKAFQDEYTRCLNYEDTLTVLCDSYILMFETMDDLSSAPSIEWWIRNCRNSAYKSCLRRKALQIAHERDETDDFPSISNDDKFKLWDNIKKIGNVNTFMIMPVPYSVVGFTGIIKNTIQGFSPKKKLTIITVFCSLILISVAAFSFYKYVLPIITTTDSNTYLEDEEIFLDSEMYSDYEFSSVKFNIDNTMMEEIMDNAAIRAEEKVKEDELEAERIASLEEENRKNNSSKNTSSLLYIQKWDYSFMERDADDYVPRTTTTPFTYDEVEVNAEGSVGTAANIVRYSGDEWLDKEVNNIVTQLINKDLNDIDRLGALYSYVCKYGRYGKPHEQLDTYIERAKYFYKYRIGTSAEYSAAFYALCSAAGYDCTIIEGYFTVDNKNGKKDWYKHEWVCITLNGIEYHFDPEADSNAKGTDVNTHYFMAAKGNSRWELFCRDHQWTGK